MTRAHALRAIVLYRRSFEAGPDWWRAHLRREAEALLHNENFQEDIMQHQENGIPTGEDFKALDPVEAGRLLRRLEEEEAITSVAKLARRVDVPYNYAYDRYRLAEAPADVQAQVKAGELALYKALEVVYHGNGAGEGGQTQTTAPSKDQAETEVVPDRTPPQLVETERRYRLDADLEVVVRIAEGKVVFTNDLPAGSLPAAIAALQLANELMAAASR